MSNAHHVTPCAVCAGAALGANGASVGMDPGVAANNMDTVLRNTAARKLLQSAQPPLDLIMA